MKDFSEVLESDFASIESIFAEANQREEIFDGQSEYSIHSPPLQALLPQIKTTFSHFLQFVPVLYEAVPQEYGTVLTELFCETLRGHDGARLGLIEVLMNFLDETLLSEYMDKLMAREAAVLTEQSAFRVKVLQFYKRWTAIIDPQEGPSKEDNDSKEIRAQLKRLANALSLVKRELPPIDLNSLLSFYCDDEVISTVESILSAISLSGPIFWSQSKKNLFQCFLRELYEINAERFTKKSKAHDNTLIGSNTEVSTLLNLLTLGKPQMPLQQVMLKIIKILAIKSDKMEERLGSEAYVQSANAHSKLLDSRAYVHDLIQRNAELEKTVRNLETKLKIAEAQCALLPILEKDNYHLRQTIANSENNTKGTAP